VCGFEIGYKSKMPKRPGHNSGQSLRTDETTLCWGWREYLAALVAEHGTLTAVAWKLLERGESPDDVASVERGLRRLRERGQRDGGLWGQRLLRRFGVPRAVEDRLRWMGLYHSPFNDLPLSLCEDQLRLWDRPPIAESRARVWLGLGAASVALRRRDFEEARRKLESAEKTLAKSASDEDSVDDARIELALSSAYLESRIGTDLQVRQQLEKAAQRLASGTLAPADRACFLARLVDQQAFALNRRGAFAEALALYQSLPTAELHPFASYRREAGLAFGLWKHADQQNALRHARLACQHAGDGGYTRLRVMALLMLARIEGHKEAQQALLRAAAIATRLGDDELLLRVHRAALPTD